MTGYLWAALSLLAGLAMAAFGGMASEEIRDRLGHLPHAILRLAARRLDPYQRITAYEDEWLPELTYILKEAEARPITRLITGTRYALGILIFATRIAQHLHRAPNLQTRPGTSREDVFAEVITADIIATATAASKNINLANGDTLTVPIGEPGPDGTQLQAIAIQLSKDRRHWKLNRQLPEQ